MSNTKTHPRATCDCGRPATVRLHSEWICSRCANIEREMSAFRRPRCGFSDPPAQKYGLILDEAIRVASERGTVCAEDLLAVMFSHKTAAEALHRLVSRGILLPIDDAPWTRRRCVLAGGL